MNRRNLFKMLVGATASVVCAPLAKLLPRKHVCDSSDPFCAAQAHFTPRAKIGQTINIRKPARFVVKQTDEDFIKAAVGRFEHTLAAEEDMREAWLKDLDVVS